MWQNRGFQKEVAEMEIMKKMNQRVKKFNILDIKLAQGAAMSVMLIIVKVLPQIMEVSIGWFVALAILCGIRPMYVFFIKD